MAGCRLDREAGGFAPGARVRLAAGARAHLALLLADAWQTACRVLAELRHASSMALIPLS